MEPGRSLEDHASGQKQERNFSMRLYTLYIGVFLFILTLIIRLAVLQFVENEELTVEKMRKVNKEIPISPIRGNIYDAHGYPIARSVSTQSIFFKIEPETKPDQLIRMAKRLALVFQKLGSLDDPLRDPAVVLERMDAGVDLNKKKVSLVNYMFQPRRLKSQLSRAEMAYFSEHRDEYKGIEVVEESIRKYDARTIGVQLVGYLRNFDIAVNRLDRYKNLENSHDPQSPKFLGTEDVGFDGIEFMYQNQLRGRNGVKSYPVNAAEKIIGQVSIVPPVKGNNLYLTIDKDVQLAAEDKIMQHLDFLRSRKAGPNVYAPNARAGYAVAMEVNTGRVVAMASMPDYDPNIWAGSLSQADYEKVSPYILNGAIRDRSPDFPAKELKKHPRSLVPAGSVIKPLTVLLGMKEGFITPFERYRDQGVYKFGYQDMSSVRNSNHEVLGTLTPAAAIQHSSNVFMAMVGDRIYMKLGKEGVSLWDRYMTKFGLGITTGSGLPNEQAGVKEYLTESKRSSAQSALIYSTFGQQGKYTAIQLAQFVSMLANRGKRMQPLFVDRIVTSDGIPVQRMVPNVLDAVNFSDLYWNVVHDGMERVSHNSGVRDAFANFPYKFGCKTGTSQQQVSGGIVHNAVFIAFAPLDHPKLAVAVVVPEGGYGAFGAAPIARSIFDAYDRVYGLEAKKP